MERKIGEIKQVNGEWYQCLESSGCKGCAFQGTICEKIKSVRGECVAYKREDRRPVIFKKLEKVGEPPYRRWLSPFNSIMVQRYRLYGRNVIMPDEPYMYFNAIDNTIEIELKQNKEDMEEKELNLKPFDLQKAKEGKPVCTRDGRKARIICFNKVGKLPIIALVKGYNGNEDVFYYLNCGKDNKDMEKDYDLMMLPEKRSGWAKVRKDINLYDTKEEADRKMTGNDEYVTAKVFWEE